ncbi:MAG: PAS domain S-box-containing protein [Candidatus Azotimanducaceae bacterium]|jgi:PAS domain S-box-containing protein
MTSENYNDTTSFSQFTERLTDNEMYLNTVFNNAGDPIFVKDEECRLLFVNDAFCTIFGLPRNEIIGKTLAEKVLPSEREHFLSVDRQVLKEGKEILCEETLTTEGLQSKVILTRKNRFVDPEGNYFLVGVIHDITERKQMEEELLKSKKIESVGLLAGGIAHDFNNIHTALFGNIQLALIKLPTDHPAFNNIQKAGQALEKATKLTQQLLTYAVGGDPILEMIDIEQVIQDSIKFSLSDSNIDTTLKMPENLWQVKADAGQISEVITNLIINADQAMPEEGALTFEAENIENVDHSLRYVTSQKVVKLSIIDVGSGISAENLNQIFDPYFTTKKLGSGLGLATANSIINKHNGHISVVSELGTGTTFTIYLPADGSTHQTRETIASGTPEQRDSKVAHILLMDDDQMILDLLTEMIKSFGYTVESSVDGNEAIKKYIAAKKRDHPFDVVIMDLTIPGGMGGKEALQKLLAIDPAAKVIVSSGYSTDPVMAIYSEHGFKGRLVKPFNMEELREALFRQIEKE